MISYFVIQPLPLISNEHLTDLFDLIGLGERTSRLKIENLLHSGARENVVTSF
jgi:hypothetical protein